MISQIHPIPAFSDNYIWAIHEAESSRLAVVDPGDATPVMDYLRQHHLALSHILITHHHADHTGGLPELAQEFDVEVLGPEPSNIKGIDHYLHEGDSIELFGQSFSIFEVPGHTLDHIAYYHNDPVSPILFCGDTLFAAGCGRLFEGTPEMMVQSLGKLAGLNPETRVYCTHEYTLSNLNFALAADADNTELKSRVVAEQAKRDEGLPTLPSTIGLELATNPFLRCDQTAVIDRVVANAGHNITRPAEVFASLRSWKDSF